nr:immunoglobulin heavy chain junction region [Macaca mulatta]MOW98413.1 immunoglobulin heavy chain junction region [Macaca mulatta]MOW99413.1 immunoglobulin heavy chain junction region [Macaca mulatta]MOW99472.1 immunoglobulin heavy chain junction region [Macaca mulatta]MOW99796.1 immunoglobulin heavy chain junction region [Macaca mulatta]
CARDWVGYYGSGYPKGFEFW